MNLRNQHFGKQIHSVILFAFTAFAVFSITAVTGSVASVEARQGDGTGDWNRVPGILKNIVAPKFPDRDFVITKYGAVPDGKTLCSAAIEKAVEACAEAGGGRVVIPRGTFLTGAIHLKSNVNLHISEGAVLRFSTDPNDYLPLVLTRYEGIECMNYSPLIYAYGQKNVAVTGKGILDGQADNQHWWPWVGNPKFGWKKGQPSMRDRGNRPGLAKMNDDDVPVAKRIFGPGHYLRPTFVEFYKCTNVLIEGVTLENAPFWFLHPTLCTNVTVDGIKTNSNGPNTDGCDPESCKYVLIKNCIFNDGDDCIAIKSGRNGDGRRINIPSADIIVEDCQMKDGHGGVSIGSEVSGGCHDVYVQNCKMSSPDLDQAIRIKSNKKRGGTVSDIFVRDIKVGQVREAIVRLTLNYDPREAEDYNFLPTMKNIFVQNVTSEKSEYALYFDGLPDSKIRNVVIKDCKFSGVESGDRISDVEGLHLENDFINGRPVSGD